MILVVYVNVGALSPGAGTEYVEYVKNSFDRETLSEKYKLDFIFLPVKDGQTRIDTIPIQSKAEKMEDIELGMMIDDEFED